jgi:uncharacterized protein (DUF2147 family)
MKLKGLLIACFVLLSAMAILAQADAAKDPITGTWTGTPGEVTLSLKYDGKNTVTGTVVPAPGEIKKGSFDPKTGALRLEGDAKNPNDGAECRFVLEGKVENGTATGTASCGDQKIADFKMTRK